MSRTKERIRSPLALVLLVAAMSPVHPQSAAPSTAQVPPPPQAAAATPAVTATPAGADKPAPAPQADKSAAAASADKSAAVCFKLTGHCVAGGKAPAAKSGTAASAKGGSATKRPLNLNAPDVRTVVSADELKEPLQTNEQIAETQEADTVSVKGDQGVPPDVPGGFGALWWAVNHPSQAWRILAPAE